jgi:hypothetical protein
LLAAVADTQQAAYAAVAGYATELQQKQAEADSQAADTNGNEESSTNPEHMGPIAKALFKAVSGKKKDQSSQSAGNQQPQQQLQQQQQQSEQSSRINSSGGGSGMLLPGGLQRAHLPASLQWAGTVLQMADAPISLILDMR